jgi:hypothetical protein
MGSRQSRTRQRNVESGSTLFIVAGFLFVMLGIGALAIDLASMYVARNESQRAADSAALAGAKVFVESGCVTLGDCSGQEGLATTRATQAALQSLVAGQPVTVQAISFTETSQNPQITVQVVSSSLPLYFASAVGITSAPNVGATATAEAYNPSGAGGGSPIYCTSCVRPWLIPNCDQTPGLTSPPGSAICGGQASLLNISTNYGVSNQNCTPTGVIGAPIRIQLQAQPTLFGALDVDSGAGVLTDYQSAITTCFTGQTTCGTGRPLYIYPTNPALGLEAATQTAVENLLHVTATGLGVGQDYIDTTVCPPQIHAGALNPLVVQGVVAQDGIIATSDSIVTAYIYDNAVLVAQTVTGASQPVTVVGFAQIFVTQVDLDALGNTEVQGVILGVAGCGSNSGGACNASSSIQGPTTLPVRLISPGN